MALTNYTIDYWDCIDIGQPGLNHSQGFFTRTHSLHEKDAEHPAKNKRLLSQQSVPVIKTTTTQKQATATAKPSATTTKQTKASNKENVRPHVQQNQNRAIIKVVSVVKNNTDGVQVKTTTTKSSNLANSKTGSSVASSTTSLKNTGTNNNGKGLTKSVSHQKLTANKLYEYHEVQKNKREELVRKLKAEEEKELKYKFHAKPVPKFVKIAPSLQAINLKQQIIKENEMKKKLIKQQSMPNLLQQNEKNKIAPLVPACADPDRMKAKEELKKRLAEKYKPENVQFRAKPAYVLQQPVFQPKHNFKAVDAKPFKLTLTTRLLQRSTFDKQLQQNQAIKERQKEIMQRQKDMEERKVLRRNREFKANKNPFGR